MALLPEPISPEEPLTLTSSPQVSKEKSSPPNGKTPFNLKPIIVLIFLIVIAIVLYFGIQTIPKKNVITTVQGKSITKNDLEEFERIYNAQRKFQITATSSSLVTREEVLKVLKEQILIEVEAKKRGIGISRDEVEKRKNNYLATSSAFLGNYDLSEKDLDKIAKFQIVREKLEDLLTTWREAEFVSVLVYTLDKPNIDVNVPKAKKFLEEARAEFQAGKDVRELAENLRKNPELLKIFPQFAIQYKSLSSDPLQRRLFRVTKSTPNTAYGAQERILALRFPTKDDIWCSGEACFLIRVLAGNDGTYKNLDEWLSTQNI